MDVQRKLQVIGDAVPVRLLRQARLVVVHITHTQHAALVERPLGDLGAEFCIPSPVQPARQLAVSFQQSPWLQPLPLNTWGPWHHCILGRCKLQVDIATHIRRCMLVQSLRAPVHATSGQQEQGLWSGVGAKGVPWRVASS